jgi:hypothetical protein
MSIWRSNKCGSEGRMLRSQSRRLRRWRRRKRSRGFDAEKVHDADEVRRGGGGAQ